jgi:predicted N-acetyltransferase YhbS
VSGRGSPARVSPNTLEPPSSVLIGALAGGREDFARLTYPRFCAGLTQSGAEIVAIGARADGNPIGLSLARLGPANTAQLLSLNVAAPWRGRGIGAALIEACENALAARSSPARCIRAARFFARLSSGR